MTDLYVTDDAEGEDWRLMLGDSCERLAEVPDESVDLSVYSPPFDSLYVYSPTSRDLGNSASRAEFLEHYGFIIRHMLRVTKPGRMSCVHVAQVPLTKVKDGLMGLSDFRGDVIRVHLAEGWVLHGEVTVDKDPQFQACRTKTAALLFVQLHRNSLVNRPALADYVLIFRKPGEAATPVVPDVTNEEWIEWARPIWTGIRETDVLNVAVAREDKDERHLCPLQLPLIERCVRLWSNPGETVLSPFAGIGSEGVSALRCGRRFVGIELKPSYWQVALRNLERASAQPSLFGSPA